MRAALRFDGFPFSKWSDRREVSQKMPGAWTRPCPIQSAGTVRGSAQRRRWSTCSAMTTESGRVLAISVSK